MPKTPRASPERKLIKPDPNPLRWRELQQRTTALSFPPSGGRADEPPGGACRPLREHAVLLTSAAMCNPLDQLCIDTIRFLSVDAVQQANSGHPGMPLGAAPMAYVLWTRLLKCNPANPDWPDRDRFVLSAGHGSMLLYSLLYLTGYDLSLDDIKQLPPVGQQDARPSRTRPHARGRSDHRPARPGFCQRRRHGHRRSAAGGPLQPARVTRSSTTIPTRSSATAT